MSKNGAIKLEKITFNENEFAIGVSVSSTSGFDNEGNWYSDSPNMNTKGFRTFMNQCVGSPNLTIYKNKELRDERYEKGKQILLRANYEIEENK